MTPTRWIKLEKSLRLAGVDVSSRAIDTIALGRDASHYDQRPQLIARPTDGDQVAAVLAHARDSATPLTFRSGGTSLNGQAGSESMLVDTRRGMQSITVLDSGERVRVEPGATIRRVNAHLSRYGRRLGPDPASEIACTVGGMIANNSSGMRCGTRQNSYATIDSIVVILADGTRLDTSAQDADAQLWQARPDLAETLLRLRDELLGDTQLCAEVERQFGMKNTMGYGLNALLDFSSPADILCRLMVGSEGTLGFVESVTLRTVHAVTATWTALIVFPTLEGATAALPALVKSPLSAIELLDSTSLLAIQRAHPDTIIDSLTIDNHAALLVDLDCDGVEKDEALGLIAAVLERDTSRGTIYEALDSPARAALWAARKGIYAAVAEARPSGTTAILEDIAVPVDRLLTVCTQIQRAVLAHGYDPCVIFGHARDGNLHFMITESFGDAERAAVFERFTGALVDIVLRHGGVLKAEHGTGHMMAPYLERQYGRPLTELHRSIKHAFDPDGILNPGVIIATPGVRPAAKLVETVEAVVDRCVECGYCEPVCPSRSLTLTPRQRIVVRREELRAQREGNTALAEELRRDSRYDVQATCAVDGMCATACPVAINTGDLVRHLRAEDPPPVGAAAWRIAAQHWRTGTRVFSAALSAGAWAPRGAARITRLLRRVIPHEVLPEYAAGLPGGGKPRHGLQAPAAEAVYFPSCVNSMFGEESAGRGVHEAFLALAKAAGITVMVPEQIANLCCGTPWSSKGNRAGAARMATSAIDALLHSTDNGRLPVVVDASSCTEGLRKTIGASPMPITVIDAVEYVDDKILDTLPRLELVDRVVLHPTCSSVALGLNAHLERIARAIGREVWVPPAWTCCGFAGDRGLLHPELTASATAEQAAEIAEMPADYYLSLNRTCELGMTRATRQRYQHVLAVLAERHNLLH